MEKEINFKLHQRNKQTQHLGNNFFHNQNCETTEPAVRDFTQIVLKPCMYEK